MQEYMLTSFPELRQVNYIRVSDPTWRPLILDGLGRPTAIAIDSNRLRLFLVDETKEIVVWYHLSVLPSGLLMTDGRQHRVLSSVVARDIRVDDTGKLLIAGRYEPELPAEPVEAIFQFTTADIDSTVPEAHRLAGLEPKYVWTSQDSAVGVPASAQLTSPAALGVDSLNIFWGNGARSGSGDASLVRASRKAEVETAEDYNWVLANNVDAVRSLSLTAADIYYSAGDSVYGVPKRKTNQMCGDAGEACAEVVHREDGAALRVSSMVWDGAGTIFAVEQESGSIQRFACGSLSTHLMEKVCDAPGAHSIALLAHSSTSSALMAAKGGALACFCVVLSIVLPMF